MLGEAQRRAGRLAESLQTCLAAAGLAHELGETEAEARAALEYEESRWRFNLPAGVSVQLLRRALANLGQDQTVLHARLHICLAQALMPVSTPEQTDARCQQALALARRANDPRALYEALYLSIRSVRRPERSEERLAALDEMIRLIPLAQLDRAATTEVYGFRMQEHLERGDLAASLADRDVWVPAVRDLQQPLYSSAALMIETMLALLAGRFSEAERVAEQAVRITRQLQVEHVDGAYGMQMFTIRREQGRLAELAPVVRQFVAQHAGDAVWRPGLALIYSELDLRAEARQEFERLAADDFASLPQDDVWTTCMVYLAEVCAYLEDAARAAELYERLRPYAGYNIMVGYLSLFLGPADFYLGRLSATRQRWTEAEHHFLEALDMNTRMEAWPWLAHTRFEYAALLYKRGRPADHAYAQRLLDQALETAHQLGMQSLTRKITAVSDR